MEKWLKQQGEKILKEVGIKEGHSVLDFGCGSGVYTLIVSKIVGKEGIVHAIDSNHQNIEDLKHKMKKEKINNVKLIKTRKKISFPVEGRIIDVVLVYDVYHLLDNLQKINLIKEIKNFLKYNGIVSFHVTHLNKEGVKIKEIQDQMEINGFKLKNKLKRPMFHWSWIEEGLILNFVLKSPFE